MKQHVVSQGLLRRWVDARGRLVAHRLVHNTTKIKAPRGEGYIAGLISHRPDEAERRWGHYEEAMPAVFGALDRGDLFDHADLVAALKDFLALHFARSRTMREMFMRSRDESQQLEDIFGMTTDPDLLARFFREQFGLDPAGPEALLLARDTIIEMVKDRFGDGGPVFERRLEEHFAKFQEVAHTEWCVQIGIAQEAEFLIGDDPVQVVDHERRLIGIASGVSIGSADTLLMPLGPIHIAAIANDYGTVELRASGVARINRIQVLSAQEKVYYRCGTDLGSFVSSLLESERTRARDVTQA
jgi:hypothetical protein